MGVEHLFRKYPDTEIITIPCRLLCVPGCKRMGLCSAAEGCPILGGSVTCRMGLFEESDGTEKLMKNRILYI